MKTDEIEDDFMSQLVERATRQAFNSAIMNICEASRIGGKGQISLSTALTSLLAHTVTTMSGIDQTATHQLLQAMLDVGNAVHSDGPIDPEIIARQMAAQHALARAEEVKQIPLEPRGRA